MDQKNIGKRIDEIRKARKWSVEELARRADISYNAVRNHIQTGKMNTEYLLRYAETLGCKAADLTDGTIRLEDFELTEDISSYYPWNIALDVGLGYQKNNAQAREEGKDDLYGVYIPALLESLKTLTEREQKVLDMRYKSGMTLEEAGKVFGVTGDRIRQIEARALRKLRHPRHYKHWHFDTLKKYVDAAAEASRLELENIRLKDRLRALDPADCSTESQEKPEPIKSISIEDLELSVRSFNCLRRAGVKYISDMAGWTFEDFMKVRTLGRKSMDEIISKLRGYGIEIGHEASDH